MPLLNHPCSSAVWTYWHLLSISGHSILFFYRHAPILQPHASILYSYVNLIKRARNSDDFCVSFSTHGRRYGRVRLAPFAEHSILLAFCPASPISVLHALLLFSARDPKHQTEAWARVLCQVFTGRYSSHVNASSRHYSHHMHLRWSLRDQNFPNQSCPAGP